MIFCCKNLLIEMEIIFTSNIILKINVCNERVKWKMRRLLCNEEIWNQSPNPQVDISNTCFT